MTTGEKIRKRRIELNMTMEELGNAIGVQRSAINKYEKGQIDISSSRLSAIAEALGVSPIDLMEGDDCRKEEHLVLQNMDQFSHVMQYMDREDYDFVIAAFDRAYKKMKELGVSL